MIYIFGIVKAIFTHQVSHSRLPIYKQRAISILDTATVKTITTTRKVISMWLQMLFLTSEQLRWLKHHGSVRTRLTDGPSSSSLSEYIMFTVCKYLDSVMNKM